MTDNAKSFSLGENRGHKEVFSAEAGGDGIKAGNPVKLTGNNGEQARVINVTGTDPVFGVALNDADTGVMVEVLLRGIVKVEVDGAITAGNKVGISAGKIKAKGTGVGEIFGVALLTTTGAAPHRTLIYVGSSDGGAGGA